MSAYKVVGRFREKELQESWNQGKPGTQAKKRVYISLDDFIKYSPDLITRWETSYDVEVYKNEDNEWIRVHII